MLSKIVVVGGGTGLFTLLSGIKRYWPNRDNLTAVVTVADDGGSSGRLCRELHVPPPGDVRNCLVALADDDTLLARLFQYRFDSAGALSGHSFGNLFLAAMTKITGSFYRGVTESGKVLAIQGRVLPVTLNKVILAAELLSGRILRGQAKITGSKGAKIKKVFYLPVRHPVAAPGIIETITEAEAIILGPGSLYTSVIPNLLVSGVAESICCSKAKKVYVANIMTQYGETNGFGLTDHLSVLVQYGGKDITDYVLVNTGRVPPNLSQRYAQERSYPVKYTRREVAWFNFNIVERNLVSRHEFARHDPNKLGKAIRDILTN